ncbi:larval cuticle protein LCP-30-like [Pectinophora gossypiella]|uniref:larval cuticle protein LCP-30-like n=1 Tax=Pectinophora gossypiella TaxID=13191 RepID=UPI00214DFBEB|nr:larval cuticle protein LCP-30-like [Pectinophora gossypiella]
MKSLLFVCLAFAVVNFGSAEDDGQYRPGKYGGDDGKYRHTNDGRYFGRNGKYDSIYSAYQPLFSAYTPYQQLIAPVVTYDSIELAPLASSLSAVKYQPITPKPLPRPVQPYRLPVYSRTQYTTDRYAAIVRQDQDLDLNGYHYAYQTQNGIAAEENGSVAAPGTSGGTRASGFYEYVGDDGVKYRVDYIADENGFQPRGAHLPQSQ